MLRPGLLLIVCVLFVAAPAAADLGGEKSQIDGRIAGLHDKIAAAHAREHQLASQIDSVTTRIRSLETQVGAVSSRLATLQNDLALHRRRLAAIQKLVQIQTLQLRLLHAEYLVAVNRLNSRLVALYKSGNPGVLEVVVQSKSFQDVLDQVNYMSMIANQDKKIATEVGSARVRVRAARVKARKAQVSVASEARVIAYRAQQQSALRDQLASNRTSLAGARSAKRHDLAVTRQQEQSWRAEAASLASASAQLASQIAAAQTSSSGSSSSGSTSSTPSTSGLIWPVPGPITSPFGMRWGSLHPGIDIGAPMGTPIKAAASGTVLVASYNGGYGNLVVIDHGNGIATAYAHQSQIAVSVGQNVSQGQVIGYVGSTGFSTGPHLHFEVRVNGTPVDPMGYL